MAETTGRNLNHPTGAFPDHDALVSMNQGVRPTYAQFPQTIEPGERCTDPCHRSGIASPPTGAAA